MRYPFVIFDWGDTIMKDDPVLQTPMFEWRVVEAMDGAEEVLRALSADRIIVMATGAAQSSEFDIHQALQRVGLDQYFDYIFCFKNTGLKKPSREFYAHVLNTIGARPADAIMVGDHFENDVMAANAVGLAAAWFNPKDAENRKGEQYQTIHHLREIFALLKGEK
jgi:putative hydrolase of the HAD superfamily